MKTEAQIKKQLKEAKIELRKTQKQFDKYDNHDDMDALAVIKENVATLEWVLED